MISALLVTRNNGSAIVIAENVPPYPPRQGASAGFVPPTEENHVEHIDGKAY